MPNTQEWQSENLVRAFPFVLPVEGGPPNDFWLDLRFFPDRWNEQDVYLSEISYDVSSDTYTIELKYVSNSEVAISGSLTRLNDGVSRLNRSTYLFNQDSVLIFTPGPSWEDPSWGYSDPEVPENYSTNYDNDEAQIEPSLVNPGPNTIRRIFIADEVIPDIEDWGRGVEQKIIGGYNVNLTESTNALAVGQTPASDTSPEIPFIEINAEGGTGLGYPPESAEPKVVRTINGVQGDKSGNLKLSSLDCLGNYIPKDVAHSLQLTSDCMPCCGCESYRAYSAAISRRSTKLKEICTSLGEAVVANAALYNEAVEKINENRLPIVRVRNMRVYSDRFRISVQNICSIPVYAHIGVSISGGLVTMSDFSPGEIELIRSLSELNANPLPVTNKDYDNTSPDLPTGVWTGYIVGQGSSGSSILPIPPGGYTDITFVRSYPASSGFGDDVILIEDGMSVDFSYSSLASADLRDQNMIFNIEANGLYGGQLTYGCKKDSYSGRVEEDPFLPQSNCSTGSSPVRYRIVPV